MSSYISSETPPAGSRGVMAHEINSQRVKYAGGDLCRAMRSPWKVSWNRGTCVTSAIFIPSRALESSLVTVW